MTGQPVPERRSRVAAWLGAVVEVAWWWGVSTGVWLLTLSSVTNPELAVAAACGLCCALAARIARHAVGGRWRLQPAWVWWIVPLGVSVVIDTVRLVVTVLRFVGKDATPGRLVEVKLPASVDAAAAGREALASMAISATPGTFVADALPDENILVVHSLVRGWPEVEQVVRR